MLQVRLFKFYFWDQNEAEGICPLDFSLHNRIAFISEPIIWLHVVVGRTQLD